MTNETIDTNDIPENFKTILFLHSEACNSAFIELLKVACRDIDSVIGTQNDPFLQGMLYVTEVKRRAVNAGDGMSAIIAEKMEKSIAQLIESEVNMLIARRVRELIRKYCGAFAVSVRSTDLILARVSINNITLENVDSLCQRIRLSVHSISSDLQKQVNSHGTNHPAETDMDLADLLETHKTEIAALDQFSTVIQAAIPAVIFKV